MKLLTHTSLFMVTMSMVLFFFCGVSFYFVFKQLSADRLEGELRHEMNLVLQDPQLIMTAVDAEIPFFDRIDMDYVDSIGQSDVQFFDSLLFISNQEAHVPVRYIQFFIRMNSSPVRVRIYMSTISSDDLTERIAGLITIMAILFALGIYMLNRHVFNRTWSGFYNALKKIQLFKAGDPVPNFPDDEIDEFDDLNSELLKMSTRISSDYHNLKGFTSHATHEFQTPLAVIISKADLLMQNENYSEEQYQQLSSIQQYARQLSRMIQALSFLFKIDNQQFAELSKVRISDVISEHMNLVKEQSELRGIKLDINIEDEIEYLMHPDLADVLILNLLRNAMNHNLSDGLLKVQILGNRLVISNTGQNSPLDQNYIFGEFKKGVNSSGLGLGLSIARRIAENYNIELQYKFDNQMHNFSLVFNSSKD